MSEKIVNLPLNVRINFSNFGMTFGNFGKSLDDIWKLGEGFQGSLEVSTIDLLIFKGFE